jgi:hypothetical protein
MHTGLGLNGFNANKFNIVQKMHVLGATTKNDTVIVVGYQPE